MAGIVETSDHICSRGLLLIANTLDELFNSSVGEYLFASCSTRGL